MKRNILRGLKWLGVILVSLIFILVIGGALFMNLSPQFGGSVTEEQQLVYAQTGHYADGVFLNEEEIIMKTDCHSIQTMIREFFEPDPRVVPLEDIKVEKTDLAQLAVLPDSVVRITWLGHSSFLIQMDGKVILLDPVWGKVAAPHHWFGRVRFNSEMPFEIEALPEVDAVIISHDHYDHLDYPSIKKLRDKTRHFYVPLGVGNHFRSWKVAEERITEMDWWDEASLDDIGIAFLPSRHMSGRGLSDQSATLWGSWALAGKHRKIYFSGDGGYGKHFKEIGERFGPFDLGLMECGQYNDLWPDVHMVPEETVVAGQDVKAGVILPIHWGAFMLAPHSWTDPIERVTKAANIKNVMLTTPQIGETVILGKPLPKSNWWERFR